MSARRWYKFHASTWLLLALCAARLVHVNLISWGYPFQCYVPFLLPEPAHYQWDFLSLIGDVLIGLTTLTITIGLYEYWRRARLRIHLSTAVVLMIVAGLLLWLNVAEHGFDYGDGVFFGGSMWGWPFPCIIEWRSQFRPADERNGIYWMNLLTNSAVVIVILAGVAAICERLISRREVLKP